MLNEISQTQNDKDYMPLFTCGNQSSYTYRGKTYHSGTQELGTGGKKGFLCNGNNVSIWSDDFPGEHNSAPTDRFCSGKQSSQEAEWSQPRVYCMPRNVETWLLWSRRLRSGDVFLILPCEDVAKVRVPSWQAWLVPHLIPHLPAKEGRGELSSPACKLSACQTAISTSGLTLDLLGPHAPPGVERQNQHPLTLGLKNLCHWNTVSPWD